MEQTENSVQATGQPAENSAGPLFSAQKHLPGTSAAEHLPPSFPGRAAWGTAEKLRAWQSEALEEYFCKEPRDFLAAATPGAGKTTFALRLAAELLARKTIDRITVVTPTEHLKKQWANAADRAGVRLDPDFKNSHGRHSRHFHGIAVTYAQVANRAELHRDITLSARSLIILDEVHHGGDALSWGDAIQIAFEPATRRLSLTGTPFRSDTAAIPFVRYFPDENGIRLSHTDYTYGYGRALADGVVRPVLFMVYAGHMRWRSRAGDDMEARLGEGNTADIAAQAWRTALDPGGDWIPAVFHAANQRLTEVRNAVPDAAGLVIASDHYAAKAYATILERICGQKVTVVLSDDKSASSRIEKFSESNTRWMVAVRMVSEGVDIPRLSVGVYATSAATPLYFSQAIGRFVRARRRGETAAIFLPNVSGLMALAHTMELQRDHALDRKSSADEFFSETEQSLSAVERLEASADALKDQPGFEAISSQATFDRVVYDSTEFGRESFVGSEEERDFIGIPGILDPDQLHELLLHRQARQAKRTAKNNRVDDSSTAPKTEKEAILSQPLYRTLKEQRTLLNSLVAIHARSSGQPHGIIHAELRKICGGPAVAQASVTQLQKRINSIRNRINTAR